MPLTDKVFGVGLARTGTTSMHQAMGLLGLNSAPDSIPLLDSIDENFLACHDAFFDNPIPFRYRQLEAVCPDARWIVTQRPVEQWLDSMQWLFGPGLDRLDPQTRAIGDRVHRELYGSDTFDAQHLGTIYERHYDELAGWVSGRDAIWIHVDRGITWEPICELLDLDVPAEPFPHSNKRRRSWRRKAR
ncbi:MAG: sulfotransferase [Actinobacteria bacterium]|nr:sulfotransferase [Actinomycetota bacterium]